LRLADDFDAKWNSARQAVRKEPTSAVRQVRELHSIIDDHKSLEHYRSQVLATLGDACLAAGDTKAAVSAFEQLLDMEAEECKPTAKYPSSCASAQLSLATAKVSAGDSAGALELMGSAAEKFRRQIKLEGPREPAELQHYVHLLKLAEAEVVYGVTLARVGKSEEAKKALNRCIVATSEIVANTEVQPSVRTDAQEFMDMAKGQKSLLR
jgi:tetratricopeptide (TPR) repeat protein